MTVYNISPFASVYDTSRKPSFDKLEDWLKELRTYCTKRDVIKMLVGNKIDKVMHALLLC